MSLATLPMGNGRRGAYMVVALNLKTGSPWHSHHGLRLTREEAHAMAARQRALPFVQPYAVIKVVLK